MSTQARLDPAPTDVPMWHPLSRAMVHTPPRGRGRAYVVGLLAGAALGAVVGSGVAGASSVEAPSVETPSQAVLPEPFCQWSYGRGGVTVFGDNVQAFRVRFRSLGWVKVDVPNRGGRQWVSIDPQHTAEDDTGKVQAKVSGKWRRCVTA